MPGWCARRELQPVVPKLCRARQMHGDVPDTTVLGSVLAPEEGLTAIKPREWVLLAVERRELEAGPRMEAGVGVVIFLLAEAIARRRFRAKRRILAW